MQVPLYDTAIGTLHQRLLEDVTLGEIKLPLQIACEMSTLDIVEFLAEFDEECLNAPSRNGDTPLHCACRSGNLNVVKYLLEKKVSLVSERNCNDELPVHLLCEVGNVGNSFDSNQDDNGSLDVLESLIAEHCRQDIPRVIGHYASCTSSEYIDTIWLLLIAHPETVFNG